MLQKQAVEPGTLSILKQLMDMSELKQFSLVGGTALALKYGHRKSIDLDLFSYLPFDNEKIVELLQSQFGEKFSYRGKYTK